MDTDNIKQHVRSRFDHNRNKQVLKEKYEAKLLFADQGGMWKASPEFLTLITTLSHNESFTTAVILDEYDTPVEVNTKDLYNNVLTHWQEQMNAWYAEFQELGKKR